MANADHEEIQVECYSGYKVNERPVVFTRGGMRREILEIVDRWYEGGPVSGRAVINYFKVKTKEGDIHLLLYEPERDVWSIRLEQSA